MPGAPVREAVRSTAPSWGVRALSLALLAAAVLAAFGGVTRNGWILVDDPSYVVRNPHVTAGLTAEGLRWFLREPHGSNWHPVTSLSHMLDAQWFGLEPAGHHATSLALHVLNALLLAVALWRLTRAWWRSLVVAALFALHPLRVESVAWVAERKDVLSGMFFLLTLWAYAGWAARPSWPRHALVAAALALGLMAKPMLVTLPFLLLLLDAWPLGRLKGGARAAWVRAPARTLAGLAAEKGLLFALAVASACVTFVVQRHSGAVSGLGTLGLSLRVGNALLSWWRYVGMTLWPAGLAAFYPLPSTIEAWRAGVAAAGPAWSR
jgi:protein O-mannosyl-transferase